MATPYIPDSYTLSVRCLFNTISPSYDIIYQKNLTFATHKTIKRNRNEENTIFITMMVLSIGLAQAQGKAEIKFDKTTHDFGTFSENNPVVSCTFKFTNIGDAPLVIHQAVASCGCTVPEYTQEPIMPGKTGTIKVTYNGTDKYPGHFKKSITLRTNAKTEMIRLFVEGDMTAKDAK